MILQSLYHYYQRNEELPRQGWIRRGIDYVVILERDGTCIAINSLGTATKGKTAPREMLVPSIGKQAMKHTNSGVDANFLWDNSSFIFGRGNKGDKKIAAFIETLARWSGNSSDEGIIAVTKFCQSIQQDPELATKLFKRFQVEVDFEKRDPVLVFRLHPDLEDVHTRNAIRTSYEQELAETGGDAVVRGNCIITGKTNTPIAINETVIKNVWGAQTSGANIISFNRRSFESYGKNDRGGENAPVSIHASFAYTTALNHLLRKDSPQRIQVGDASTVFWADQDSEFESIAADIFGEAPKDDPDRGTRAVHALLSAIHSGKFGTDEDDNHFHVLGLSPNAARISIRFYHCLTLPKLAERIAQHFKDLEMVRGLYDPQYPSLFRLLTAVAVQNKADNIPPNLGGAIVDAIFAGPDVPYPALWLNAAVGRCRAEQNVNYLRAATIKACLNRQIRRQATSPTLSPHSPEKEFLPMLDLDNTSPAYRLGRLFAVLEKIQEEASEGKLNSTIRDRYYGAASSSPASVFPTLIKLAGHHIGKLGDKGKAMLYRAFQDHTPDSYIGTVLKNVADFPAHLSLPDQGRFALGYYHQRQAFFSKQTDSNTTDKEGTPA